MSPRGCLKLTSVRGFHLAFNVRGSRFYQHFISIIFILAIAIAIAIIAVTAEWRRCPVVTGSNVTEVVNWSCWVFVAAPPPLLLQVHYKEMDIECDAENVLIVYDGAMDNYTASVPVEGCEDVNDFVTSTRQVCNPCWTGTEALGSLVRQRRIYEEEEEEEGGGGGGRGGGEEE